MKYYAIAIPIIAAVALGSYFAKPTNSVTHVQKQHTKLFYDRIEPDPNATTIDYRAGDLTIEKKDKVVGETKCRTGRVRWNGACWKPSRIPRS